MSIKEQIRKNIRDIREHRNLTQAEMGEKLGLSETAYAKWERGEVQIRIERLQQIAQVLEVDLEDLIKTDEAAVILFKNARDNFISENHFNVAVGNSALEAQITILNRDIEHLHEIIQAKNELLDARDREIELFKQQITVLQSVIDSKN